MITDKLYEYARGIRRRIHEYPEVGFELDETVKLVSEELRQMGIEYTYAYGKGSVVAELGRGKRNLALRADMDALPIEEKTGLPYSSRIRGQMHACGHDAHTAILLAVARYLKENEEALPTKVRLIFQPSEEGAVSGAKMMTERGVCDGVDRIICTHCDNDIESGNIGICYGDYMAACVPLTVRFIGKSSHATLPEHGVDAIAMANEAYVRMKKAVAEEAKGAKYIWSVGRMSGGQVHNVIADLCEMDISFRFYDGEFSKRVEARVRDICADVAKAYGGEAEISWKLSTGAVRNDEDTVSDFEKAVKNAGFCVQNMEQRMSSEDFGWYLERTPGMIFRFGTRNERLGCTALAHRSDFSIDEEGMRVAIDAFCTYVMSYKEI